MFFNKLLYIKRRIKLDNLLDLIVDIIDFIVDFRINMMCKSKVIYLLPYLTISTITYIISGINISNEITIFIGWGNMRPRIDIVASNTKITVFFIHISSNVF